ncbi:MAG: hypothetical protein AAGF07_02590 [Patescibacteria group bacterium]
MSKELRQQYWLGCQRGVTFPDSEELNYDVLLPVTEFIFNLFNQMKQIETHEDEGNIFDQYIALGASEEQAIFFAKNHKELMEHFNLLIDK